MPHSSDSGGNQVAKRGVRAQALDASTKWCIAQALCLRTKSTTERVAAK